MKKWIEKVGIIDKYRLQNRGPGIRFLENVYWFHVYLNEIVDPIHDLPHYDSQC